MRKYENVHGHTFENCRSFELGSLEVVTTILGSRIPAREYSLSMCVVGSGTFHVQTARDIGINKFTHLLALHQMRGPFQEQKHLSSTLWVKTFQQQEHP